MKKENILSIIREGTSVQYEQEICTKPFEHVTNETEAIAKLVFLLQNYCEVEKMEIQKLEFDKVEDFNIIADYKDKSGRVGFFLPFAFVKDCDVKNVVEKATKCLEKEDCTRAYIFVPTIKPYDSLQYGFPKIMIFSVAGFLTSKIFKEETDKRKKQYIVDGNLGIVMFNISRVYRGPHVSMYKVPIEERNGVDLIVTNTMGRFGLQIEHEFDDKSKHPEIVAIKEAQAGLKACKCDKCFVLLERIDTKKLSEKYKDTDTPVINDLDQFIKYLKYNKF